MKKQNRNENPRLCKRLTKDGRISLYLEFYKGGSHERLKDENGHDVLYTCGKMKGKPKYKITHAREKVSLGLYLYSKPRTQAEKVYNENVLRVAKLKRLQEEEKFLQDTKGYKLKDNGNTSVKAFVDEYVTKYTKKDLHVIKIAFKKFCEFLSEDEQNKIPSEVITFNQLTSDVVIRFRDYLQGKCIGSGGKSLFARFKKVLKNAQEKGFLKNDICKGVVIRVDDKSLKKEILSDDEITAMVATIRYEDKHFEIRKAFLFCLQTGLRYCDVKDLTFANIDYSNKFLKFEQNKTKGHSKSSNVTIPLSDETLEMVGKPSEDNTQKVFILPSKSVCNDWLKKWVTRSGITKNISWHCARHSFGTRLVAHGADIKTIQTLLGHSSLQYTEMYLRAMDELKIKAIENLKLTK